MELHGSKQKEHGGKSATEEQVAEIDTVGFLYGYRVIPGFQMVLPAGQAVQGTQDRGFFSLCHIGSQRYLNGLSEGAAESQILKPLVCGNDGAGTIAIVALGGYTANGRGSSAFFCLGEGKVIQVTIGKVRVVGSFCQAHLYQGQGVSGGDLVVADDIDRLWIRPAGEAGPLSVPPDFVVGRRVYQDGGAIVDGIPVNGPGCKVGLQLRQVTKDYQPEPEWNLIRLQLLLKKTVNFQLPLVFRILFQFLQLGFRQNFRAILGQVQIVVVFIQRRVIGAHMIGQGDDICRPVPGNGLHAGELLQFRQDFGCQVVQAFQCKIGGVQTMIGGLKLQFRQAVGFEVCWCGHGLAIFRKHKGGEKE